MEKELRIEIISWFAIIVFFFISLLISKEKLTEAMKNSLPKTESVALSTEQDEIIIDESTDSDEVLAVETPPLVPDLPVINPLAYEAKVPDEEKTENQESEQVPLRNTTLYFMVINGDGSMSRKAIVRSVPKTGGPLRTAIENLLQGPNYEEKSKGCRNLISDGTKLLGASVKDGVATLNFNERFEYNNLGIEGLLGQLEQIVYTATEFNTVSSVQFLVEGQRRDYLGSEGVWIGSPLNRDKFH